MLSAGLLALAAACAKLGYAFHEGACKVRNYYNERIDAAARQRVAVALQALALVDRK